MAGVAFVLQGTFSGYLKKSLKSIPLTQKLKRSETIRFPN